MRSRIRSKVSRTRRFDAVIVGSGLVGSWVAKELVDAGLEVLLLEAGRMPTPDEVSGPSSWSQRQLQEAARRQPVQSQNSAWMSNPTLFVDDVENPYLVAAHQPFTWIRGRQVGGRSLTWGGVTLRFSDYEFGDPERDGIGPRWPISHADLSPFYAKVERVLGVSGARDGLPQLPDGEFLAPAALTAPEHAFKAAVERRWSDRRVIISRGIATDTTPPSAQSAQSDRERDARWSRKASLHVVLPAALASGRLTVRPNSVVSHLLVDTDTARACGVAGIDRLTMKPFEVRGRAIVLSASTIESLRILLNTRTRQHPEGLGNSSGLLGRGLVDHLAIYRGGPLLATQRSSVLHPSGGPHSIYIPRFRNLCADESLPFKRGYGIWGYLGRSGNLEHQRWGLTALLEVVSRDVNRVELDDKLRDAWGIPSPRICMQYSENERLMSEDAARTLRELAETGELSVDFFKVSTPGSYVHELGGARMGLDPSTSVLNRFNQCWDAENVFVVDGACFASAGWQNPTLTMMALAARASSHMIAEMHSGRL